MLDALEGVRVLEIGSSLTAHYVGRQLGQMGAEVLKVEPPNGDPSRRRGPFVRDVPHQEGSTLFLYLNIGKRGITLDRSTPTGRGILGKLAAASDIVLWGDDAKAGREAVGAVEGGKTAVWMLISPYGETGPQADWVAHSLNIFHAGGEGYLLPGGLGWKLYPDREPIKGAGYLGEYSAGDSMTAACVLARMLSRPRYAPVVVDASVQEALISLMRPESGEFQLEGTVASRATRSLGSAGQVRALDGWVQLMGAMDRVFAWMGKPEWEEHYRTVVAQRVDDPRLAELINEWTAQKPKWELYREGQAHKVALGPILAPTEVLVDPQMEARGFFTEIEHPHAGRLKYPLVPYDFTPGNALAGERRTKILPAPLLGQHNVEVMEGELDFSRREIVALLEAGII